jgi:serine carboxypeptidase-like clade 2
LLIICLLFAASFCQTSDDDIVTTIIPTYRHNWYSGYLNISNQKDIHYVFQESQNDRDNDPLILWVSSFPGCSSLFCMTYEIGAFQFLVPEEPSFNISKWAWNMKANLLFLETPGAGFSTGPTNTSDVQVTLDHLLALMQFYARFPTQKKNDLYLAGHGYAGILAPLLAKAIITRN